MRHIGRAHTPSQCAMSALRSAACNATRFPNHRSPSRFSRTETLPSQSWPAALRSRTARVSGKTELNSAEGSPSAAPVRYDADNTCRAAQNELLKFVSSLRQPPELRQLCRWRARRRRPAPRVRLPACRAVNRSLHQDTRPGGLPRRCSAPEQEGGGRLLATARTLLNAGCILVFRSRSSASAGE